ncbi:hypothetical protein IWQ62_002695 [Dispira parvispora]|uniref:FAM50A/XAP5 C-terminal domain-containing protein n=1 Tax=Dispira parvispora TaxID=1520584 RepID=A0A9W8AW78_9FUNG|nr:hypothetical protein IWQ62_002695 [Dispira parvispora]
MAEYKGGRQDSQRHLALEKARDKMLNNFERQRDKISKDNDVRIGSGKFVTQSVNVETKLKTSTVGLVQLEDFQRIRGELEERKARAAAKTLPAEKERLRKKRKTKTIGKLSFQMDDAEDVEAETPIEEPDTALKKGKSKEASPKTDNSPLTEETNSGDGEAPLSNEQHQSTTSKRFKFTKNPDVDTSFLPDRERDEQERLVREELRQKWLKEQERIKGETISITYSYWDGSGHRRVVQCKKGDSIATFLDKCRQQFYDLRGTTVDNLMYIKEDLIIPHHYTFYDFIINKTRGKSGPLFSFDVHDDIRLQHDASVEKDESHAGKVCLRTWYDRHKHIFPASRWEIFDPKKNYGKYTIKGGGKQTDA